MKRTRKGFTLVELLIVIAIMAALSGSMMIAGSTGTKKADVAKVATGIATVGNAINLFITISGDTPEALTYFNGHSEDFVTIPNRQRYIVTRDGATATAAARWYVSYDVTKAPISSDAAAIAMIEKVSADNGYVGSKGLRVYF